jgi:hypothetical protein
MGHRRMVGAPLRRRTAARPRDTDGEGNEIRFDRLAQYRVGWYLFFFKIYKIKSECNFCFLKLAQSKVNGPSLLGSADFASISLYGHNLL